MVRKRQTRLRDSGIRTDCWGRIGSRWATNVYGGLRAGSEDSSCLFMAFMVEKIEMLTSSRRPTPVDCLYTNERPSPGAAGLGRRRMSKPLPPGEQKGRIARWVLIVILVVLALYPSPRKSFFGRVARFAWGEPGGKQIANDLADEVLSRNNLSGLQDWSIGVLSRYREGKLKTSGKVAYWSMGSVMLDTQEVPEFLKRAWGKQPEVAVRLSSSGAPECVTVCWYLSGILVGPRDYATTLSPWYLRKVRPGVYTYFIEK